MFTSLACLAVWGILIAFSNRYRIFYLILTLNIVNTMMDISWFYAGLEQFKYTIFQNSIFKILGAVLLFVFIKNPSDLKLYVFIMSLTSLLGTMTMWLYLPKFLKKVPFKNLRIFSHLKETFIYFIPTIATSIYTVLDKTLIGLITHSTNENGYYEQATKIMNMIKALTFASLNTVLGPRISYLFAEEKYDEIRTRINQSINYIFFLGFGMMFGLIGIADLFVPLFFGKGYDKVIPLLKIMSPLILIIGISNCLGSQYYNPAGLRAKSAKFIITGSFVNLIFNLIFIPRLWSYGACIGTIIAESVITFLYVFFSNGYFSFKGIAKLAWKKLIAGVVMLGVMVFASRLALDRIPLIILEFLAGSITYIVVLIILRDNSIQFVFDRIKGIIQKKF